MATALAWDLFLRDGASPGYLRVAAAADKAAAATERATKGTEAASARMASAGAKMSKAITLPLLGIAAVSVDMAAKFQQSTNVLVTAAGESAKNLGMIRKGILDIATTTGTSWHAVTDGMYQLEKAGYRGADALRVEKAAAQAAREEGASLSTVTAAATSIMASYHLKAADAVMVMNEMKTAAGESKTTMELFAGSLSTVLPLASANKISFADIAGSLASLTQHGTSADEAAQELAFTMRGLAAPNQVAQKEMAQLGISSVDVAQKLGDGPGGRGLAGTLNYLSETVLHKMGPAGLVLLNTFNQSKVAAHDAQLMYAKLPPEAQKIADEYMKGQIPLKDFNKAIGELPGTLSTLGRQWKVTYNNAHGFQAALRSGVSGTQTYSDAIKKMTGGANGLNTVLQLTGESMSGTNERIARIADSSKSADKNVQGWASTQKLFSVQLDIAKQKMQAVGIQLGTALIPVVLKIVDAVQKAVGWFQNLSGTDKKILGWSLAVMAAMGPILSLGARLSVVGKGIASFAANASARIASIAGATDATATRVGDITRRMVNGTMGVLAGAMASRVGGNSGKGWLASILLGAAGGGAVGGVVGAAVGGVSAAIFKGIGLWNQHKDAAKAAAAAERGFVDNLTQAINDNNGAIGNNLRLVMTKTLQDQGILGQAQKLGVNIADVVSAAMGDSKAKFALGGKIDSIQSGAKAMLDRILTPLGLSNELNTRNALLSGKQDLSEPLFNTQGNKVALSKSQLADAQSAINAAQGTNALSDALTKANVDFGKAISKANQYSHALNDNRVGAGKFADQLESLRSGTSVALDANGQLTQSLDALTVVGQHNTDTLQGIAKAALTDASAAEAAALKHESLKKATHDANGVLATNITQLLKTADAAGFNNKTVADMIGTYLKLPKSVITRLEKTGVKPGDIQAILDKYNLIPRTKTTTVTTIYKTAVVSGATAGQLASTYRSQVPGHAAGTNYAQPGWAWVGEQGPELMQFRGGEKVLNNRQSMAAGSGVTIGELHTHVHYPEPGNLDESSPRLARALKLTLGR